MVDFSVWAVVGHFKVLGLAVVGQILVGTSFAFKVFGPLGLADLGLPPIGGLLALPIGSSIFSQLAFSLFEFGKKSFFYYPVTMLTP